MTAQQLFAEFKRVNDTNRTPYATREKFAGFYQAARLDWLRAKNSEPETEYTRRALNPFRKQFAGIGDSITLPDDLFLIRKVIADFLGGLANQPAMPVSDDAEAENQLDPFQKGTDWFPKYRENPGGAIGIQAKTMPLAVRITYLIEPQPLDFNSETELKESDTSALEIIERALARKDLTVENLQRYQVTAGREVPAKEQNPAG